MKRFMVLSVACLPLVLGDATAETKKEQIAKHIQALKDPSEGTRAGACKGIADIGRLKASYAKDAIAPLAEMVRKDNSARVRAEAATALGAVDPEEYQAAVEALIAAVKDDKDNGVHRAAISALGQLGPKAKDALPVLNEQLEKLRKQIGDDKAKQKQFRDQLKVLTGAINSINGNRKK
jgi:HEAT repeat protein